MHHIKFGFDWPRRKCLKSVNDNDDHDDDNDGRQSMCISSPCEPNGSCELSKLLLLLIFAYGLDIFLHFLV